MAKCPAWSLSIPSPTQKPTNASSARVACLSTAIRISSSFAFDTGKQEYPIWQLAEQLKLLDRVSFVPFQQEAEPLLLHGDLYIHVLSTTRVQYRTLEAMGRGLAVVTRPNHGSDYLIDGQTCRLVETQTPEAWRNVLLDMIRDRPKTAAIARRGQQHIHAQHSMARMLEQFGSICRQSAGLAIPMR